MPLKEDMLQNPPAPEPQPPVWERSWVFVLLVIIATLAVYSPSYMPARTSDPDVRQLGFVWDDDVFVWPIR